MSANTYPEARREAYIPDYEDDRALRVAVVRDLVFLQVGQQFCTASEGVDKASSFEVQAEIAVPLLDLYNEIALQVAAEGTLRLVPYVPAVALFVTEVGFKQLGREHVDDPGHGGLVRDRLTRTLASCVVQQRRDPARVRLLLAGRGTGERAGLRLVGGGRMVAQLQAMEDTA